MDGAAVWNLLLKQDTNTKIDWKCTHQMKLSCPYQFIHTYTCSSKCLHCTPRPSLPTAAGAAVTSHFPPCHFGRALVSGGDKMKRPPRHGDGEGERPLRCERQPQHLLQPKASRSDGGCRKEVQPPVFSYISSVLIVSRASGPLCQPSSFGDVTLSESSAALSITIVGVEGGLRKEDKE